MGSSGYIPLFDLASGGMGRVSLAVRRQGGFERLYAVKRLKSNVIHDDSYRRMFLTEARLAGLIRHPNVVSVLDVGQDEEGPFLVMDWVDGVSLSRFLPVARAVGPVGIAMGCRILAAVARGLDASHVLYAHDGQRLELVHRDVSPQNILLAYDGTVRVTDFGIAKALGRGPATDSLLIKGKIGYMSPEHLQFKHLDRRSDLYSLGCVLFEVLAGERLYRATATDMEDLVQEVLHEPPRSLAELRRDVPPELDELLFSLLAKTPEGRPATAREVAAQLEAIAATSCDEDEHLDGFLQEHFGEAKEQTRRRIAEAIAKIGKKSVGGHSSFPAPARGKRRTRTFTTVAAAGAALALTGAALAGANHFISGSDSAARGERSDSTRSPIAPETTPTLADPADPQPPRQQEQRAQLLPQRSSGSDTPDATGAQGPDSAASPEQSTETRSSVETRAPDRRRRSRVRRPRVPAEPRGGRVPAPGAPRVPAPGEGGWN